jgi:predicted  nucleic acid-binding Zn-ribbon protein
MGACASKRPKSHQLKAAEEKYDVLASLFATCAQDLTNLVAEYEASRKAEELAWEEVAEVREQIDRLASTLAEMEEEHEQEIEGWRLKVELKDEEIVAYQRVVDMRTEERDQARHQCGRLEGDLRRITEHE